MIDCYAVLQLKPGCADADIRRQYRRLAKQYHPDRNHADVAGATARLQELNAAYEVLSDPQKRRLYDEQLAPAMDRGSVHAKGPTVSASYQADPEWTATLRRS